MSSGSYIAYKMIIDSYERQAEESRRRWNSYTDEQKEAIYKFDRWWYEYKKKKEQEQYEELCEFFKKILKPFSYIKKKINYLFEHIIYLFFKKYYNFQFDYFLTFKKDYLKYNYLFQPIKYIDLNDYQTVGRILINPSNVNFKKLKTIILVKYRNLKNRKAYLRNIAENCKFITEKDIHKLNKIFQDDLMKKY